MLITRQPVYAPPWTGLSHLNSPAWNRLCRVHRAEIAKAVGGLELGSAAVDKIIARADAVPRYAEEFA